MKTHNYFLIFILLFSQNIFGQIYYPNIVSNVNGNIKILRIEKNPTNTKIEFEYTRTQSNWVYIFLSPPNSQGAYCIKANGIKYLLTKTEGIGNADKITRVFPDRSIRFSAYFEALPDSIKKIDLIEGISGGWDFYGIELLESYASHSDEKFIYSLTLKSDGSLKSKAEALSDVLYKIPAGTTIDVYSFENGYYKINDNGNIGYLSELFFKGNDVSDNNSTNNQNIFQKKECKSYFRDGNTFLYYVHNGISVTMSLSVESNYGKYYIAYIAIENLTGHEFNFEPEKIRAILINKGEMFDGEVLSSEEYLSKVKSKQSWNAVLMTFGESYAASQAGYSKSKTSSKTSSYSNSYGSASGYYGNNYGSVSGRSTTYGTSTTQSTTTSYNGSANYAAQQNAQRNINK